jgi:lysyl-tRNA synthetase class 2
LKDAEGRIQIYVARDDISTDEEKTMYNVVFKKLLDIGDFIGVRGTVFRTQVGEISVHILRLILAKALKPLPVVKQMLTVNVRCICRCGTKVPSSLRGFNGK